MKKILIIDDEPDLLTLLKTRLSSLGYDVVTALDGLEALERVKVEKPNLIILDVLMPKMDGFTFLVELKKNEEFKSLPVIVLTSREKMENLFKIEGVDDYVLKPFQPEDLIARVRKHLG